MKERKTLSRFVLCESKLIMTSKDYNNFHLENLLETFKKAAVSFLEQF